MVITAINPYLDDNFAPIHQEITTDTLQVIGELPPDLSGIFVRNGANPQWKPIGQYHWFDGDGMLHGVRIHNRKAIYCNRYVQTEKWKIEQAEGKAIWSGLMEPPQMDNPYGSYKNTANTAIVWHAGQLLALWEGGAPYAIKLPELETIGEYTYNGKLASAFTAHPKVDPVTGEMMFFGYSPFTPPYLQYGVVSAAGKLLRTEPIDLPIGVLMHDFAISENYTIFMDLPLTFNPQRAQRGESLLLFESDRPSRFGILPRHGNNGDVRWFESSACFVPHTLNAYEEGEEIVLSGCRMKNSELLEPVQSFDEQEGVDRLLYEWRFNLKTGFVKETMLDNVPIEFPRVNEQLLGKKTRYGYSARVANNPVLLFDALIKYDFNRGKSETLEFGVGRYGGDIVFVPRPHATTEDDGWLLTLVHDEGSETSELIVVNAQDVTSGPIAQVLIPQRVPYGFHAAWIDEAQFQT
ncbi:carotenoid oxygenase family protein [Nostoc sp.]|uniref:carotenoid oxygenase family protein n=1 Tax=Nostoc sp. TaxID=1180 RepID=UPI002FF964CB